MSLIYAGNQNVEYHWLKYQSDSVTYMLIASTAMNYDGFIRLEFVSMLIGVV